MPGLSTCTYHGVRFVYKQNYRMNAALNFIDHILETIFEFTFYAGARLQQTHVEHVNGNIEQGWRHVLLDNAQRQTFHYRRFPYARFTGDDGIILAAPHENIHYLSNFRFASDHRIDLAFASALRQVSSKLIQCGGSG